MTELSEAQLAKRYADFKKFLYSVSPFKRALRKAWVAARPVYESLIHGIFVKSEKQVPVNVNWILSSVLGKNDIDHVFFPIMKPFSRPAWMVNGFMDDCLNHGHIVCALVDSLECSFKNQLQSRYSYYLREYLGKRLWDELYHQVKCTFRQPRTRLNKSGDLNSLVHEAQWEALTVLFALAMVNAPQQKDLLRTMQLLKHCIPLGSKKREPDIQIILCL